MQHLKLTLPFLALGVALLASPAYAHGFGDRYDLPLPLSFFAVGGAATVVLSFVLIGVVVRGEAWQLGYPRLNLFRYSWLRWLSSWPFLFPIKLLSVFLLLMVISTGLFGNDRPADNLAPTFVWVIWWVGLGFFVALFGNLWALVNPWKILFGWLENLYQQFWPGQELSLGFEFPQRWGIWPAVALFFSFAWVENALSESADPQMLARLVIAYSIITLLAMFIFGKHQWLRQGEAFSVVFGILSRFSITEVRVAEPSVCRDCNSRNCQAADSPCLDCHECLEYAEQPEFNLRPPAVGLNNLGSIAPSVVAMVILLLASVTFDGFSATPEWLAFQTFFILHFPTLTSQLVNGATIASTLGLLGIPLAFAAVYWFFSHLMHRVVGQRTPDVPTLVASFVFSLVPIALAYNYAHFLSFLLIQGQQIIALVSDPFGTGWNLFGTADYLINIRVTNARFIWFFSVGVIVAGHIMAVYLAHVRAIVIYSDRAKVLKSQLPMLGLMVLYTVVSLWIVSRPITE